MAKKFEMGGGKFSARKFETKTFEAKRFGPPEQSIEQATKLELDEVQQKLRDALLRVQQEFRDELDSEYWVCAVFQTREQKEAFLTGVGMDLERDGDKYVNGAKLAGLMKVELPPGPKWKPAPTPKARWTRLARSHGEK